MCYLYFKEITLNALYRSYCELLIKKNIIWSKFDFLFQQNFDLIIFNHWIFP